MSLQVQQRPTTTPAKRQATSALAAALILLGTVEIVVRSVSPPYLIPTERGVTNYRAMRLAMQANLIPDVMFVGSSRIQIGVLPEVFRAAIEQRVGQRVSVGNFAVGGANASENVPLLEYLLRRDRKPRLVIFGVSVDQLRGDNIFTDRSAIFWDLRDWFRYRWEVGPDVDKYLPEVVRNEIGNYYHTFRYRGLPLVLLKDLRRGRTPKAYLGESVREHQSPTRKRLVEDERMRRIVREHIRDVHVVDGKYNFNPTLIQKIDQVIGRLLDAGIDVVLVEAPNAPLFNQEIPRGTLQDFYETLDAISDRHDILCLKLQDMGLEFAADSFRDPVHLTTEGARTFTQGIARGIPDSHLNRLR